MNELNFIYVHAYLETLITDLSSDQILAKVKLGKRKPRKCQGHFPWSDHVLVGNNLAASLCAASFENILLILLLIIMTPLYRELTEVGSYFFNEYTSQ